MSIRQGSELHLNLTFDTAKPINISKIGHNTSIKKLFISLIIKKILRLNEALKSLQNFDFLE